MAPRLPLDVQLIVVENVWDPLDDVWSGPRLRGPLRLVCHAWKHAIDAQDDVFTVATRNEQLGRRLNRGDTRPLRRLVVATATLRDLSTLRRLFEQSVCDAADHSDPQQLTPA